MRAIFFAWFFSVAFIGMACAQERIPDDCVRKERRTIQGQSMEPLIQNGDKVYLLHDYYQCGHEIQIGDIVAFRYAGEKIPLIKVIRASWQDSLSLADGRLYVNGEIMTNSAGNPYNFPKGEFRMLELYINDGHIPKGTYLLFGDNVRVSTDSRKFGVASPRDIIGKFELIPADQQPSHAVQH